MLSQSFVIVSYMARKNFIRKWHAYEEDIRLMYMMNTQIDVN